MSDEELEEEFEKVIRTNEAKQDHCGTALPGNKEVGIQRSNVKIKKE